LRQPDVSCFVSSGRQLLPILQAMRNRDGTAPQAKLDELIKAHGDARDALVGLKRKGENQIQYMWPDSADEHVLGSVPGTFPTVCGAGRASAQAHSHQTLYAQDQRQGPNASSGPACANGLRPSLSDVRPPQAGLNPSLHNYDWHHHTTPHNPKRPSADWTRR